MKQKEQHDYGLFSVEVPRNKPLLSHFYTEETGRRNLPAVTIIQLTPKVYWFGTIFWSTLWERKGLREKNWPLWI